MDKEDFEYNGEEAEDLESQASEDDDLDAGEEDFAALLEQSLKPLKRFQRGEKVRGRVIGANEEWIFLDLGTKGEGIIAASEFASAEKPASVAAGDWVDAYYLGEEEGEIRLTTRVSGAEASRNLLADAYHAKIPVEGTVGKEVKGGFEVLVGSARCFCPYSQIDVARQDAANYVGQSLSFYILDFKEGGRNIVLSRRELLEEDQRKRQKELQAKLQVGDTVQGKVRAVESFGAFVDLGGVDGLIPISELSWGRVEHPKQILNAGEEVTVQVMGLDWDRKRITLSLKRMAANPWSRIDELLAEEQVVTGRVVSLATYGAFVELVPGIDGLVHVSRLGVGKRINHPREVVQVGDLIDVRIENIDVENRRISLSLESAETEEAEVPEALHSETPVAVGHALPAIVEAVKPFGVLAKLPDGRIGLIPVSELLAPEKAVLRRHYQPGQQLSVQVLDITEGGKRIRLSERAAEEAGEAQQANDYLKRQPAARGSGLGTMADLLKKKK